MGEHGNLGEARELIHYVILMYNRATLGNCCNITRNYINAVFIT